MPPNAGPARLSAFELLATCLVPHNLATVSAIALRLPINLPSSYSVSLFSTSPSALPCSSGNRYFMKLQLTVFLHLVAVLRGDSKVGGTFTFEQSSESSPTTISYDITGHDPSAERGVHVHQFGDNTNGCTSAGPHCTFSSPSLEHTRIHHITLPPSDSHSVAHNIRPK